MPTRAVGNMAHVLDGNTDKATYYEYDPAGRATVQGRPNAATTYFCYDLAGGRVESLTAWPRLRGRSQRVGGVVVAWHR